MESGRYGLAGETGQAVAEILRVPFDYLYSGTPTVDCFHSQVWIPSPPPRTQHLQSMKNDISNLFSYFLEENQIKAIVSAELSDGLLILLGHETSDGRFFYSCLILAECKLANAFLESAKKASLKGLTDIGDVGLIKDISIDTFDINVLYERIQWDGRLFECDTEGLSSELATARKRIAEKGSGKHDALPPGLENIFRNFLEALIPSIKSHVTLELTKFFLKKCEERGHEPKTKIADTLIPEFTQEFERIGNLPLSNWPDPNNAEYFLLREWLRKKLCADSSQEQRTTFLEKITQGTDFRDWKENYEREVKEGKRMPSIGF
jgi:hypothetical protein